MCPVAPTHIFQRFALQVLWGRCRRKEKEKKIADTDDEDDGTQKAKRQKHEEVIATHELAYVTATFKLKLAVAKDGNPRSTADKDSAPLPTTILLPSMMYHDGVVGAVVIVLVVVLVLVLLPVLFC